MPKFLENKLKEEYGAKSGVPYKIMNKLGVMKGNKETLKGKLMGKRHGKDVESKSHEKKEKMAEKMKKK